ncbi:MAG: hypothetical protein WDM87_17705 [Terracidiphilus sp.]
MWARGRFTGLDRSSLISPLLASPQNSVNGETTNSVNNVAARQPFQGVPQGSLFAQSTFIGNYNSLQTSITKRMAHGFQFQGSYVWSKNLDELMVREATIRSRPSFRPTTSTICGNRRYGLAGDDRDQRAVVNFAWIAPKFASAPSLPRYLLSDWEFSGIGLIQSGAALSIFDGNAGSVYGNFNNRAQATGSNPSTHGSLFARVVGSGRYLDANAFTRAPEAPNGTSLADQDFGNSSVGLVRGPGQHNVDFAVERIFPVNESKSFRFPHRVLQPDEYAAIRQPEYQPGFSDPTLLNPTASSSFGEITGEEEGPHPRIVQFALKFLY